jgi:nucleoid-associated protein YgaU
MGFLDFIKEAGEKIMGGDEAEAAEPKQAPAKSPEEIKSFHNRRRAMGLVKMIESHGFEIEDLSVRVDGDLATVSGKVEDQATKEKVLLAIGNTEGIARVDDQFEVVVAEPEAQFHTVVSGDTLGGIAKQYYGNAGKYPVIFEANKPMLTDPDKIYPGQVLRIPPIE